MDLRKDEPHLLSSFEDFLTRVFSQLQEANEEKNEMECALKKSVNPCFLFAVYYKKLNKYTTVN